MNRPKDVDNQISLKNNLAQEFAMSIKMVLVEIRHIAWEGTGDPIKRLNRIGEIADRFHNCGPNYPDKLVKVMLKKSFSSAP